jgi:hypothetical protein
MGVHAFAFFAPKTRQLHESNDVRLSMRVVRNDTSLVVRSGRARCAQMSQGGEAARKCMSVRTVTLQRVCRLLMFALLL